MKLFTTCAAFLGQIATASLPEKVGLGAVLFLAWFCVTTFASWYRLREVPGPFFGKFSYGWTLVKALGGRAMDYEELSKYGPLVRVATDSLVTDDPDIFRQVNGNRNVERHEWFDGAAIETKRHMLATVDMKTHDGLKSKALAGYSGREVPLEAKVNAMVAHFIANIRAKYISRPGQPRSVDFTKLIRAFTLDVITETAFGQRTGFMDTEEDLHGYTRSVEDVSFLVAAITDYPPLRQLFRYILGPLAFYPTPKDKIGMGKMMG